MRWFTAIAFGLAVSNSLAATYYVSPDGNDSNAGTLSNPWKTISKANQVLRPGDTVQLRGGNYDGQAIKPSQSGSSESQRITYMAYPGEQPVIRRVQAGLVLSGKEYITVDGIDMDGEFYRGPTHSSWPGVNAGSSNIENFAKISNSQYNVIRNVTWRYAHGWAGLEISGGSHHNKFLDSTFDFVGTYDNGLGDDKGDTLQVVRGSHNLVQGCTFRHGGHSSLVIEQGHYNVVRENYFDGDFSDVEGAGAGARTVELKGEGPTNDTSGYNLFEYNVLVNTKTPSDTSSAPAMKVNGIGQIVRRNFIYNNHSNAIITANGDGGSNGYVGNNHIYHNVMYNNGRAAWALFFNSSNGVTNDNNVCMNNIMYENRTNTTSSSNDAEIIYSNSGLLGRGNRTTNNFMMKSNSGDSKVFTVEDKNNSLSWYENTYPQEFSNNMQQNPDFASAQLRSVVDFKLSPSSPAIDAGAYLTATTSSGSGQTIPVQDANFFTDGFGVIPGDIVKIGTGNVAQVLAADYVNQTITVDKSISWSRGDQVSLNFNGAAPDVGAYEDGMDPGTLPPDPMANRPAPPQNLQATTN